jgi:hypothetical protein
MSDVIMQRFDGVTPEQYDELRRVVGWDRDVPEGMTFHVASFGDDTLRMTDVWDSAGQFETFVQTRILPALQQVGVEGMPQMIVNPMHDIYPSAAD